MFAVIEDNDGDSNGHRAITATFTSFQKGTESTVFTFDNALSGVEVLDAAGVEVPLAEIAIADSNRNGRTEATDVTIYRLAVSSANRILETNVVGITPTTVEVLNAAIGSNTTMVITAATATQNFLRDPATGETWVNVRSTSGAQINLIAVETNLDTINAGYTEGTDGRLSGAPDAEAVAAALSKDSGIFVAAFGIIRSEWKEMLDEWASDDSDDTLAPIVEESQTLSLDLTGNIITEAVAADPNTNTAAVAQVVSQTFTLANTSSACDNGCVVDANQDGQVDKFDFDVEYNRVRVSRGVLTSFSYGVSGAAVQITVVITGASLGLDSTETPPAVQDTIRVRFSTEPIGDTLLTEIRSRADSTIDTQTLHNAFDDLTSDDEGAAANNLGDTLARQARNLNIDTAGYRRVHPPKQARRRRQRR